MRVGKSAGGGGGGRGGTEEEREKYIHPWSRNIWVIKVKFECHILSNYWNGYKIKGDN